MSKLKAWSADWIRSQSPFGAGKQGRTFRASRVGAPSDDRFVLKELIRQTDLVSRSRMFMEVSCLKALRHSGIATFVASNAEQFETSEELFLVTEWIAGPDLKSFISSGPANLDQSVTIVSKLLDTLEYCHGLDVVHRDIKPEHVILRDGQIDAPVLIDFGLSFNEQVQPPEFSTASDQGIGNFFIRLPEQMLGDKRNPRSDVTQCVGVLFYLLTGRPPGIIRDSNEKKPHERENVMGQLAAMPPRQSAAIQRIFDIGFSWAVNSRWASAVSLKQALDEALNPPAEATPAEFASRIDAIVGRFLETTDARHSQQFKALYEAIVAARNETAQIIQKGYSSIVSVNAIGGTHNIVRGILEIGVALRSPLNGRHVWYKLHANRIADEIQFESRFLPPPTVGLQENNSDLAGPESIVLPISDPELFERATQFQRAGILRSLDLCLQ